MTQSFELTVNGRYVTVETEPDDSLLHVLRNQLDLRGTRFGCGLGQCGACFVLLDGAVVPSCDTPMWSAAGKRVVTVEGLGSNEGSGGKEGTLHRVQQAILNAQAAQCAFCISGIAVSAAALVDRHANSDASTTSLSEEEFTEALDRNLCRCGVQRRVLQAVRLSTGTGSNADSTNTSPQPQNVEETTDTDLAHRVTVEPDGTITVRVGKVEIGQGILTALRQIAADALGVSPDRIRMLPASTRYGPDEGITAGSLSISTAGPALREACTQLRAQFPEISAPEPIRQIGRNLPRLDLPAKIAGQPAFIHDLRLPGQLFGRVLRPPSPGATLHRAPSHLDGLDVQIVRDGSFIGVIGPDEAGVARALKALRSATEWDEHETLPDENDLGTYLRSGPHETVELETPKSSPPSNGRRLRASYSKPFLAHASMAPSCAAARWNDDGTIQVWSHSQGIRPLRTSIARSLGLDDESAVHIDHVDGAGCYGHNAADDVAFDAVLLARAAPGRPVHVQWTRHDELTWAPFGSAMEADVTAVVDDTGRIQSWEYELWSQGHNSRPGFAGAPGLLAGAHLANPIELPAAADVPQQRGGGSLRNADPIYDFPHRRVTGHRLLNTKIRSSALRSLGAFMNVFAIESFMDELAEATGTDPLDFRLAHLTDDRARAVLLKAAESAGWGTHPPAPDTGRGIAFARYKNTGAYCAVVAEVEATEEVRVRQLTLAVDVGQVINPDGVRNQIEGGAIQATSWTLKERVRFDRRHITSDDWESYPILRFSETPDVTVEIVEDETNPSLGAGEAAQGPTAAAIANALTNALDGVRVRNLPLTTEAIITAIHG